MTESEITQRIEVLIELLTHFEYRSELLLEAERVLLKLLKTL